MRNVVIITILSLFFITCKKDSSTTPPQLTYKSVNTTVLNKGEYLQFTLSFKDPAGNADSIFVEKVDPGCLLSNHLDSFPLPGFTLQKNQSADLLFTYGYYYSDPTVPPVYPPQCDYNDTCYFRFVLKGSSGNHSDTVKSQTIIIIN